MTDEEKNIRLALTALFMHARLIRQGQADHNKSTLERVRDALNDADTLLTEWAK